MLHKGLPREGVPQLGSEERAAQPRRFPASQDIGRSSVDLLPQDMAAQLSPALRGASRRAPLNAGLVDAQGTGREAARVASLERTACRPSSGAWMPIGWRPMHYPTAALTPPHCLPRAVAQSGP